MSPLGKRIIVFFMFWVLVVMAGAQLVDNLTGRNAPVRAAEAAPTAMPTARPDEGVQRLADLQTCVAADPSNLQCTSDLAAYYYDAGQYPQAEVEYSRAVELDPQNAQWLLRLAGTYIFQQKFEEAADTLRKAAGVEPKSPEVRLLLGLALSRMEPPQIDAAVQEWRKVIELAPGTELAAQASSYINEAQAR
jgi:cytochrome c-type biogenesis protein CcmH/NrfG